MSSSINIPFQPKKLLSLVEHLMDKTLTPHIIIFPLPAQGHVNSMLKLAELLCSASIHVTFITTIHNHNRLLRYTDAESRFSSYNGFRFQTLPDGVYDGPVHTNVLLMKFLNSLKEIGERFVRDFVGNNCGEDSKKVVSCIICDGILSFVLDIAEELVVPLIYFRTISASSFWAYFCIPRLIEAGELPFKGDDMDVQIANVPGMENFLRGRDLPSFCRADLTDTSFRMVSDETQQTIRAHSLILNTFEYLEGPILSQIRTCIPKIYTIGPLHSHLKTRLPSKGTSSNSLWEEDKNCIRWLDQQPDKSVIYVSFGSITIMTRDQLMEFWHGLVNSGSRFLWAIRPDSLARTETGSEIPSELHDGTKERGYMVDWVAQEQVLAHPAVGGFLTHSGWNSTLESICEGVPMICWPYFADQQINSRFVGEVWKLGLDMKDTCHRVVIEKMVRELMEVKKDEFVKSSQKMSILAKESLSEGGSSYCNLEMLIKDIKLMGIP